MKPEMVFVLENAGWPAFLVDGSGMICRSNAMAAKLFGPAIEGGTAKLSALWAPENATPAEEFLAHWERNPAATVPLKFKAKGGGSFRYLASICSTQRDGQKYFIIQLLPEPAQPGEGNGSGTGTGDTTIIHKQKLDWALQLSRTIALDFNNVLTSILGHTSLVLAQMKPDDPFRPALIDVEKSAARAAEIAHDLGTFSRQEKDARAQVTGNLNQLLERTVEMFKGNPGSETVEWKLLLERKLFAAKFDEAKMQQALVKIVENAVQSLTGFGRITLQTRNVELAEKSQDRNVQLAAGAYVCAEISDTGAGIPPEILPRVFEPFFTTKGGKHRGLGLAWVYGVVTNHGGGVAISSQPGTGTSVRVYLPAEKRVVKDNGDLPADLRGSQTVLVVDDEDYLLIMGERILSAYGYRVLTANSGQKALDILSTRGTKVDLLVTDMVMPGMSGRELAEHVQNLVPGTRVLRTSGYIWPSGKPEDESYLQKPFTAQELLIKVKQALSPSAPTS